MVTLLLAVCATLALPMQHSRVSLLEPVSFEAVTLGPGFWAERLEVVSKVTVPLVLERCFETGRVRNFQIAGGLAAGEFVGRLYDDSDVYKALEGVARALHLERGQAEGSGASSGSSAAGELSASAVALKARAQEVIDAIAAAQCDDGYLSTYYQLVRGADEDVSQRWTNVAHGHELYCLGHLIEAGVAWKRATGESQLLDVGIRAADHVASVFLGDGKRNEAPGHQELELALFGLTEATGEPRFAALATDFLERRGRTEWQGAERKLFGEYCQDHVPIRELDAPVGHAVRLMYQLAAMTDLVRATGDRDVLAALERTWQSLGDGHLYVTGGIGAEASNEGFGAPHDLPNDTAYNETCAGIGMVLWNHRMGLLTGDAKYFALAERALHNNVLAGLSLDGTRFFYVNPLASRGGHHRVPWFDCSCCPTNLARVLPSVGGLVFARSEPAEVPVTLAVLQPFAAETAFEVDGAVVRLVQTGGLFGARSGFEGASESAEQDQSRSVEVFCEAPRTFTLRLRVEEGTIVVLEGPNGEPELQPSDQGWTQITREWNGATRVTPTHPQGAGPAGLAPDPSVESQTGRQAFRLGPFVYCLEAADHEGFARNLALQPNEAMGKDVYALPRVVGTGRQGLPELELAGQRRLESGATEPTTLHFTPYFAWDNREPGEMVVWIPTKATDAELPTDPFQAKTEGVHLTASHCYTTDSVASLLDDKEPRSSNDPSLPRHTFWDHKGTEEWLTLAFDTPQELQTLSVYWYDDTGTGACRVPKEWWVETRIGNAWHPVHTAKSHPGISLNKWNKVTFWQPLTTSALRLRIQLRQNASAGLMGLRWND